MSESNPAWEVPFKTQRKANNPRACRSPSSVWRPWARFFLEPRVLQVLMAVHTAAKPTEDLMAIGMELAGCRQVPAPDLPWAAPPPKLSTI